MSERHNENQYHKPTEMDANHSGVRTDMANDHVAGSRNMVSADTAPVNDSGERVTNTLTNRKADDIAARDGYTFTGYVLSHPERGQCIINMSAASWIKPDKFWKLMHAPQDDKQTCPVGRDAQQYRWLLEHFIGYDFNWNANASYSENSKCVAVFDVGPDFRGGRDISAAIDDALAASKGGETRAIPIALAPCGEPLKTSAGCLGMGLRVCYSCPADVAHSQKNGETA